MLIVAIDTSGRKGSIALCRGDAGSFEVLQLTPLEGGTYSARLMPAIAEALAQHGISKNHIDGFVVVSGPGSFTGLRVGLSTAKALAEVLRKALATVSMLEAVALARGGDAESVTVALDAGRGEVYVGEFQVAGQSAKLLREYIAKLDAFGREAGPRDSLLLTPDCKVYEALGAHNNAKLVTAVHADEIANIGLRKLLAGEVADPETLDANYIRRSDAEIFSAPKH